MKNSLTIVFCLPGADFSGRFLECWTDLLGWCLGHGIRPVLSRKHSCNIYYSRTLCLGADVKRGKSQKPFDGKINYDYLMWIDSDILFTPIHFRRLLGHDRDIVSGVYLMEDGRSLATVREWDEEFFKKNGCFRFMTLEEAQGPHPVPPSGGTPLSREERGRNGLIEVAYTGMGFMLVKQGVFESLEYPWFKPIEKQIGDMIDFTMEDVTFCLRAREKGFRILVDPAVRVGHEKRVVM